MICLSSLAGLAAGLALQKWERTEDRDTRCSICLPVVGAMLFGGISVPFVVPLTRYY